MGAMRAAQRRWELALALLALAGATALAPLHTSCLLSAGVQLSSRAVVADSPCLPRAYNAGLAGADLSRPGGAGHALLFRDHGVVIENFNDLGKYHHTSAARPVPAALSESHFPAPPVRLHL